MGWTVAGCAPGVRRIDRRVRFQSITAFGAGAAGAVVVLGAAVEGVGAEPLVWGDWATAERAKAELDWRAREIEAGFRDMFASA